MKRLIDRAYAAKPRLIIRRLNLIRKLAPCPYCHRQGKRHSRKTRILHEIGIDQPTVLEVAYSMHYCETCVKYFSVDMTHLAPARGHHTHRVRRMAIDLILVSGYTYDRAERRMRHKYFVDVRTTTMHGWVVEEVKERVFRVLPTERKEVPNDLAASTE